MAGFEQRLGDVRPANAALAGDLVDPFEPNRCADAGERRNHLLGAFQPSFPK